MICLGLHAFTHDASAALAIDGRLAACAQEERLSRVKGDGRFPARAIRFCLADAGVRAAEVDRVVLPFRPWVGSIARLAYQLRRPRSGLGAVRGLLGRGHANLGLQRELRELGIRAPLTRCDHHAAHARAVFLASPFARATVLVIDGVAEAWSGATFVAHRHPQPSFTALDRIRFPASLGLVYAAVTEHLGFRHNCEEGKVMAMAASGSDALVASMRSLCRLEEGRLRVEPRAFDFGGRWTTAWFAERFGAPRQPEEALAPIHFDLARAIQTVVEEAATELARRALASSGIPELCLVGGLALNPALNSAVATGSGASRVFLLPAGGDAGTAIGAALAPVADPRWRLEHPYWGGAPSAAEIDDAVAAVGLRPIMAGDGVLERAAELLAAGQIGAWCTGRSEMGPRALGHRSILADARSLSARTRLNDEIKQRRDFQPFAPCVLRDATTAALFPGITDSPFMLRTWPLPQACRERLPAVVHVDGTSRVQTVTDGDASGLSELLRAFARHSGLPVLLNTSLNGRGEPLAETAGDALRVFVAGGLDFLVLEDRLLERTPR